MTFPTKQAILAYLYSLALSAWSIITAMVITGYALGVPKGFNDLPTFIVYIKAVWFAVPLALLFNIGPFARGQQAYNAAKSGTTLPPPEQNQPTTKGP